MRKIEYIVVHCTATQQDATIDSIKRYWKQDLKWSRPGYHYIIDKDGKVTNLHPEESPSNGVSGFNSSCINVCYIGGVDGSGKVIDNRTIQQRESLLKVIKDLKSKYPKAVIHGHRDFPGVNKACPCFDAKSEYKNLS